LEDAGGHAAAVDYGDPAVTQSLDWIEWKIPWSEFAGVDPAAIRTMSIGLGNPDSPTAGGAGVIYIDDIRGTKPDAVGS